jgi:hypothetical protein
MPWKPLKYEKKTIENKFGDGINTAVPSFYIKDSELVYSNNMINTNYPAIQTRNGRAVIVSTTNYGNMIQWGVSNSTVLHMFSTKAWLANYDYVNQTWNTLSTAFRSNTAVTMRDFSFGLNKYVVAIGNSTASAAAYWDTVSTSITAFSDTNLPVPVVDNNVFLGHKGRMFWVVAGTNRVKFSALNVITDWTTANDAGYLDVPDNTIITAMTVFNDKIHVFTKNKMFVLFGTSPSDFQLVEICKVGCANNNAIAICRNCLYWYNDGNVYKYDGSYPIIISEKLKGILREYRVDSFYKISGESDILRNGVSAYDSKIIVKSVGGLLFVYLIGDIRAITQISA